MADELITDAWGSHEEEGAEDQVMAWYCRASARWFRFDPNADLESGGGWVTATPENGGSWCLLDGDGGEIDTRALPNRGTFLANMLSTPGKDKWEWLRCLSVIAERSTDLNDPEKMKLYRQNVMRILAQVLEDARDG